MSLLVEQYLGYSPCADNHRRGLVSTRAVYPAPCHDTTATRHCPDTRQDCVAGTCCLWQLGASVSVLPAHQSVGPGNPLVPRQGVSLSPFVAPRPQRIIHDNGEAPLAPQCSVTNGYTAPAVFEVCVTYPPPRRGVWAANAPFRDAAIVGATREVSRAVTGIRDMPPGEQLSVKRLHRSAPASHP